MSETNTGGGAEGASSSAATTTTTANAGAGASTAATTTAPGNNSGVTAPKDTILKTAEGAAAATAGDNANAATTVTADPAKAGTEGAVVDPAKAVADPAKVDPAKVEPKWPEDWREKYAGEDTKKLELLKRYGSPEAALDALIEARNTIAKGIKGTTLKPDATPEEVAEYRKANGIPEKANEYKIELDNGLQIDPNEKDYVNQFLENLHADNTTPEVANKILNSYYQLKAKADAEYEGYKNQKYVENDTALKAEWGKGYQKNLNIVVGYLQNHFGDAGKILADAYDSSGLPLANNAVVLRTLLRNALDHDPIGTLTPGVGMSGADGIVDELKALETKMKDRNTWFKDEKGQARYRELTAASLKMKK